MSGSQTTCPVCGRRLETGFAGHPIRDQFVLNYRAGCIELCSWACFCRFFQEPEVYYQHCRQETGNVIPRLERCGASQRCRGTS